MCPSWAAANRPGSRDANRGSPTTHRRPAEVDPGIAAQARRNLYGLGLDPLVITDDGEQGHPAAGPHDRIVATASVRRIPRAWLDQQRPGGVLLAPSTAPSAATCWYASPVRAAQPPRALRGERRVHALPRPAHAPSIHRVGMARDRRRRALAGAAGRGGAPWPAAPSPLPAAIRHAENLSGGLLPVIFRLLMLLWVVKGGGEPGGGPVRFGRGEG
ncbi:protein-L-isoaspartate O-methyltransferase family protein [Streptomyces microflavus]|uniref:protein-L-isoaspartate O-methyltransferase family protein n=1 Tax=Streptomyces microflavus TaxID=1919 RepID=UPI0036F06AC8